MKLNFETKVLLIFVAVLTFGLSMINVVSFLFYKLYLQQSIQEKVQILYLLSKNNKSYKAPGYLLITNRFIFNDKYELIYYNHLEDKYVYLLKSYVNNKLKNFAQLLIVWDFVLIISLISILYFTIGRYLKKEIETKKYLETVLLAVSHKLGNFLSIQKINLEIIENKCSIHAVKRLKQVFNTVEKDFKFTTEILKKISSGEKNYKEIYIDRFIKEIVSNFSEILGTKKVKLRLKPIKLKLNYDDMKNLIYILIENAVFHSMEKIYIKICEDRKYVYFFIKNDISLNFKGGSGVGLEIAKFLAEREGIDLIIRTKKNFLTVLKIRK